ncbi:MAG: hypothetical protein WC387_03405 [Candidatus Paceibacterota bacterium]
MCVMELREFKEACEQAGLGELWAELTLFAVKQRQIAIELGDAIQTFRAKRTELLALARAKGLVVPDKLANDEVANLSA